MNFGEAIEAMKAGKGVKRDHWAGSIWLERGAEPGQTAEGVRIEGIRGDLFESHDSNIQRRLPYIAGVGRTGSRTNGFAPSQSDMLAEDWQEA